MLGTHTKTKRSYVRDRCQPGKHKTQPVPTPLWRALEKLSSRQSCGNTLPVSPRCGKDTKDLCFYFTMYSGVFLLFMKNKSLSELWVSCLTNPSLDSAVKIPDPTAPASKNPLLWLVLVSGPLLSHRIGIEHLLCVGYCAQCGI